jgi:aromatic ring-opening dioxygenase catalytic subunit (LigB family)
MIVVTVMILVIAGVLVIVSVLRHQIVSGRVEPTLSLRAPDKSRAVGEPGQARPGASAWTPLLYVLATRQQGEAVGFPVEDIDGGSISMLTVRIG